MVVTPIIVDNIAALLSLFQIVGAWLLTSELGHRFSYLCLSGQWKLTIYTRVTVSLRELNNGSINTLNVPFDVIFLKSIFSCQICFTVSLVNLVIAWSPTTEIFMLSWPCSLQSIVPFSDLHIQILITDDNEWNIETNICLSHIWRSYHSLIADTKRDSSLHIFICLLKSRHTISIY